MINCQQFRKYVIQQTLEKIYIKKKQIKTSPFQNSSPYEFNKGDEFSHTLDSLYFQDAEELLIATVAHESNGGTYIVQEHGPALGIYQMEPQTYMDIINHLKINQCELLKEDNPICLPSQPHELITDLSFATLMARLFYYKINEPLPPYNDIEKIWEFYKKYWNTEMGKATKEQFIENYYNYTIVKNL